MIHVINDERGYIGAVTDCPREHGHMTEDDHWQAIKDYYENWCNEARSRSAPRDDFVKYLEKYHYKDVSNTVHLLRL